MNKIIFKFSLVIFSLIISNLTYSQCNEEILNWYNKGNAGMYTEEAYEILKNKETKTVIVAIIDSGIDIEHEDLKGKIWVNKGEIPNNGIDDDKNGYVDDIHGWNFLGNKSGENANDMRLEKTRILARLSDERKKNDLSPEDEKLYNKVKEEVASDRAKYEGYISRIDMMMPMISSIPSKVAKAIGKENYTVKDLKKWKPETNDMKQVKGMAIAILSGDLSEESMNGQKEYIQTMLDTHLNVDFDGRAIIGDNPTDFSDTSYGNNDVEGPDALHGTHVGGIVGAIRGNSLGGDGVANDVLLMSLRAVPNGDEFDKDIALAIRYAVDNGAMIINMSFGKAYSPNKKEVYEAFKYADSKGVLCVHAAGNDHKDIDTEDNYPTSVYKSFQEKKFDHYLTIGSSTKDNNGRLPSTFSNFGKNGVDIFAPGSEICNAVPQSEYQVLQGTSMACPMVSGVAAMLKSYFPEKSMKEIADIILSSGKSYAGVKQLHPGTKKMADFAELSVTGRVVNVKNAVNLCLGIKTYYSISIKDWIKHKRDKFFSI